MSRRTLIHVTWLVISLYVSFSLARSLWQFYQASGRVSAQAEKQTELESEVAELKNRLEYVRSYEFIEKEAREKLNLQRPGEIVLVVPESEAAVGLEEESGEQQLANWQKWARLFL